MLKVKSKSHEFKPAPLLKVENDEKIYGEPYGFTIHLHGLNTPELIKLQASLAVDESEKNQAAYDELTHTIGKCLDGWDELTVDRVESLMNAVIDQEIPEKHVIRMPSLRVSKENKADAVDVIVMMAENNYEFYGALTAKIIELSIKKRTELEDEKKTSVTGSLNSTVTGNP